MHLTLKKCDAPGSVKAWPGWGGRGGSPGENILLGMGVGRMGCRVDNYISVLSPKRLRVGGKRKTKGMQSKAFRDAHAPHESRGSQLDLVSGSDELDLGRDSKQVYLM